MSDRLDTLACYVLKNMLAGTLTNAMVYEWTEECIKYFDEPNIQMFWSTNMKKLWDYLSSQGMDQDTSYESNYVNQFLCGRIYASIEMIKMLSDKQFQNSDIEVDAKEIDNLRYVLLVLRGGKSFIIQELTRVCENVSELELISLLEKLTDKQYVYYRRAGKTKYYRISSKGKKLLECI